MCTIELVERCCQLLEERRKELSIKSACRLQRIAVNPIAYYLGSSSSENSVVSTNVTPLKNSSSLNFIKSPLVNINNNEIDDYLVNCNEEFCKTDFFTPVCENFKPVEKISTKKRRYRPKISFYQRLGPEVIKSDDEFIYIEKPTVEKPKIDNTQNSFVQTDNVQQPLRRSARNKEKLVPETMNKTNNKQIAVSKRVDNTKQKTKLLKDKKNLNTKDLNSNVKKNAKTIQIPQEGLRRSARNKVKPLDPSINQRPIYEIVDGELSLTGVTDVSIKRRDRKKFAHYANFVTK